MVTTNERGHVEVRCDGCLSAPVSALGIRTWPARAEAMTELVGPSHGWAWVDGRLRCAGCARKAGCEVTGHPYGPWRPSADAALMERVCRACGGHDRAPHYVARTAHHAA